VFGLTPETTEMTTMPRPPVGQGIPAATPMASAEDA